MSQSHRVFAESNKSLCGLIEAVASGDLKAFRTLYDKSVPVLFGICVRLTRDRDLAQDVLQEAMTRIWQKAHHRAGHHRHELERTAFLWATERRGVNGFVGEPVCEENSLLAGNLQGIFPNLNQSRRRVYG
jgi:Sigma-70 region 2